MKKIIFIIFAVILLLAAPWLYVGAEAWAEMTSISFKFYQGAAIIAVWGGLLLLVAAHDKEICPQKDSQKKS